jgi:glycosyltransferase involved in cell wall biosynthesis
VTRVVIDARALDDYHSRDRGIGRFVEQLLAALGRVDSLTVTALARPSVQLPSGVRRRRTWRAAPERFWRLEQDLLIPIDIRLARGDVFHSPGLDPPPRASLPWVQTLHDVIPLAFAHPWFEAMAGAWGGRARRMRQAARVVAVSQHTADDGVRHLGLDPAQITVIPHGVDPVFAPAPAVPAADPPYLLAVGGWGPNKGYEEAFALVDRVVAAGHPHRLVMTGKNKALDMAEVEMLLRRGLHPERVELRGLVPREELVRLYQGATALVVTSRYEGFCLPALEAMACGTPVVAFANSAIPEVVGDGGTLVRDGDVDAMLEAVEPLLRDPNGGDAMARAGIARAAQFSWETAARRYAEVYRVAAEVPGRG